MKNVLIGLVLASTLLGCNLDATKKENGSFYVNGTVYKVDENGVAVSYFNNTTLLIQLTAGSSQTFATSFQLDLNQIDVPVAIDSAAEGVFYIGANSAVQYFLSSVLIKLPATKKVVPSIVTLKEFLSLLPLISMI
jgi:hypothetical protein